MISGRIAPRRAISHKRNQILNAPSWPQSISSARCGNLQGCAAVHCCAQCIPIPKGFYEDCNIFERVVHHQHSLL